MNSNLSVHTANENVAPNVEPSSSVCQQEFNSALAQTLFEGQDLNSKVLAFKTKAPKPSDDHMDSLKVLYSQSRSAAQPAKKSNRHIPTAPERVLDAPELVDDYYLNLLDWGANNNLAIALNKTVYIWNAASGDINELCSNPEADNIVTSVQWMADGSQLAIGNNKNEIQIWDVATTKKQRTLRGHQGRVSALAWNDYMLASASRDCSIIQHDVRVSQHIIKTLYGHESEICGLKWSLDGTQLASGGNDNLCCIWDASSAADTPRFKLTDACAAVKALAWCPFQRNVLATGAGTADRNIRFYNTLTGTLMNSIDTKSQVCGLMWSKTEKELLSAHGFSQNQLTLWKFPTMVKVAELTGHSSRILHMSMSPDSSTVCTAAADETLRFWKVWDSQKRVKEADGAVVAKSRMNMNIR